MSDEDKIKLVGESGPEPITVEEIARLTIARALHDVVCPSGSRCDDSPTTWDRRWLQTAEVAVAALVKADLLRGRILAALSAPSEPAAKIDALASEVAVHQQRVRDKMIPRAVEADLSSCPYYSGTGMCESGCTQEPRCRTDEPLEGWPSRRPAAPSEPVPDGPRVLGYVVATKGADGHWDGDWDGEIHRDLASGRAALAECREVGYESTLGLLHEVVEEATP